MCHPWSVKRNIRNKQQQQQCVATSHMDLLLCISVFCEVFWNSFVWLQKFKKFSFAWNINIDSNAHSMAKKANKLINNNRNWRMQEFHTGHSIRSQRDRKLGGGEHENSDQNWMSVVTNVLRGIQASNNKQTTI